MKVYIAGPLTKGDVRLNVRSAMQAADAVLALGHAPFVPHLSHLWDMVSPKSYETWIAYDLVWVAACDAILRLPGDSPGADREFAEACRLGKLVFVGLEQFRDFCREQKRIAEGRFDYRACPGHDGKGEPCLPPGCPTGRTHLGWCPVCARRFGVKDD